jgi:hypothetical protein
MLQEIVDSATRPDGYHVILRKEKWVWSIELLTPERVTRCAFVRETEERARKTFDLLKEGKGILNDGIPEAPEPR